MLDTLTQVVLPLSQRYYLKMSLLVVVLVLVSIPLEVGVPPIFWKFRLDNKYIQYPMMTEHVPVGMLAIYSILLPAVLIVQCGFIEPRFRPYTAVAGLGFILAIVSTLFVTDVFKLIIGNHRPDFIARCMPKEGLPTNKMLSVFEACTNPNWGVVVEGCKSTPSGHSSLSFSGLLFVSLVLNRVLSKRFPRAVCFIPLLLAAYIAFTRIIDHRHHILDIISGSLLGSAISYTAFTFSVEKFAKEEAREEVREEFV